MLIMEERERAEPWDSPPGDSIGEQNGKWGDAGCFCLLMLLMECVCVCVCVCICVYACTSVCVESYYKK